MINLRSEDFNIEKIAGSGQCFRLDKKDNYWLGVARDKLIRIYDNLDESYTLDCTKRDYNHFWENYFDLKTDYSEYRNKIPKKDKYLSAAAEFGKGIRILRQDPWEMLITFIISQRKNIPAIKSSVEAISSLYGSQIADGDDGPIYAFPTVSQLAKAKEGELKNCGLGYRVPYIISASQMVDSGKLDLKKIESLSDEELLDSLMTVKGVGIKVANCVSLFAYHRIDAFPIDVWIARVLEEEYSNEFPYKLYKGFGGVIQQYMFYYARSSK